MVFVKQVKEGGPAFEAGLCTGVFPLSIYGSETSELLGWCDVMNVPTAHWRQCSCQFSLLQLRGDRRWRCH